MVCGLLFLTLLTHLDIVFVFHRVPEQTLLVGGCVLWAFWEEGKGARPAECHHVSDSWSSMLQSRALSLLFVIMGRIGSVFWTASGYFSWFFKSGILTCSVMWRSFDISLLILDGNYFHKFYPIKI